MYIKNRRVFLQYKASSNNNNNNNNNNVLLIEFFVFCVVYFIHDCLLHTKILCFTLECAFCLYPGQSYIFLTKYDPCVFSPIMATCISRNTLEWVVYDCIITYTRAFSWNKTYLYDDIVFTSCVLHVSCDISSTELQTQRDGHHHKGD